MPKMKWVPTAANAILLFGTAAYAQNVYLKPVQTEGIANWTAIACEPHRVAPLSNGRSWPSLAIASRNSVAS